MCVIFSNRCLIVNIRLLVSFSQQCYWINFHRSLSDSKYPQVSRSIQANLNNTIVWMKSIPLISSWSNPHSKPSGIVPNAPNTYSYSCPTVFLVLQQGLINYQYFRTIFYSHPAVDWNRRIHSMTITFLCFFFSSYSLTVGLVFLPGLEDLFVSQTSENLMDYIFLVGFTFAHVPFVSIHKMHSFA